MISKYRHNELKWVDLESPKNEEIRYIFEEYSIPLYIKEKIKNDIRSDEISMDSDYTFASICFQQSKLNKNSNNKLIFIINDSFIISIHDEPIKALTEFIKEIELNINSVNKLDINNNKVLFAHLLKNLFIASQNELLISSEKVTSYKKQIIQSNKKIKLLTGLSFITLGAIILISIYVFIYI